MAHFTYLGSFIVIINIRYDKSPPIRINKDNFGFKYHFFLRVWDKALPATDLTLEPYLLLFRMAEALLATDAEVCFLLGIRIHLQSRPKNKELLRTYNCSLQHIFSVTQIGANVKWSK